MVAPSYVARGPVDDLRGRLEMQQAPGPPEQQTRAHHEKRETVIATEPRQLPRAAQGPPPFAQGELAAPEVAEAGRQVVELDDEGALRHRPGRRQLLPRQVEVQRPG